MEATDFAGLPLPFRLRVYGQSMAAGWRVWINHMMPAMFGSMYGPARRAEIMLESIALGLSQWVADPRAPAQRARSERQWRKLLAARVGDSRDHVGMDCIESLSQSVRNACNQEGDGLEVEDDVRALHILLQISALRVGACQALSGVWPQEVVLSCLDMCLREQLPPSVTWIDLEPIDLEALGRGAAET